MGEESMSRRALALALACGLIVLAAAPAARAEPPAPALSLLAAAIPSTDLARSTAFYTEGLGMKAAGRVGPTAAEAPLLFPGGGAILMLVRQDGAAPPASPKRVVLSTPDLAALAARLAAAGHPLKAAPHANPGLHVIVGMVEDPDGNVLELVQRTP